MLKNDRIRRHLYRVIFKNDSVFGYIFDLFVITSITLSILLVFLNGSLTPCTKRDYILRNFELFCTVFFALEFFTRLTLIDKRMKYLSSFIGFIDIVSFLPSLVALLFPQVKYFYVLKIIRVVRILRLFKLMRYFKKIMLVLKKQSVN